jgi:hypothetical protein
MLNPFDGKAGSRTISTEAISRIQLLRLSISIWAILGRRVGAGIHRWSRSEDDLPGGRPPQRLEPGRRADFAFCGRPRQFTATIGYDLPLGKQSRFLITSETLNEIPTGRSVNVVTTTAI